MYVTLLSSTCFGPWHAHPQEEQLHKHSIWYPRSYKRLYTTQVDSKSALNRCSVQPLRRARIPDAVFVQLFLLRMGMPRPETCRG